MVVDWNGREKIANYLFTPHDGFIVFFLHQLDDADQYVTLVKIIRHVILSANFFQLCFSTLEEHFRVCEIREKIQKHSKSNKTSFAFKNELRGTLKFKC